MRVRTLKAPDDLGDNPKMTTVAPGDRRRTAEASALAAACAAGALLWLAEHAGAALVVCLLALTVAVVTRLRPVEAASPVPVTVPAGEPTPEPGPGAEHPSPIDVTATEDDPVAGPSAAQGPSLEPLMLAGRGAEDAVGNCQDGISGMRQTFDGATESLGGALRGLDVARSMTFQILGQVSELGDISDRISGVVDSIRTIAGQTNLLALNATIVAAGAGDAGRGFAVVAAEVRKLAQDARAATESIDSIVGEVRDISEATIEVANGAGEEVERARGVCTEAEGTVRSVADAVTEFGAVLDDARTAVSQLVGHVAGIGSGAPI